jgi:hypothetical protein
VENEWGLATVEGAEVSRSSDERRLVVSTVGTAALEQGAFELRITVDARRAGSGAPVLVQAAREAWPKAADASASATFLGLPAAAFTFADGATRGLHVVAVSGHCVVELVILREGSAEALTTLASTVLRGLVARPSPLAPARCR